jgi:isopentenyl phosphate kinase
VRSAADWRGFGLVAAAAARLNRLVCDQLIEAGVPAWCLPPSASAWCSGGELISMAILPVQAALEHELVPLVYGDVALDSVRGGTIVSTEEVLSFLARRLRPARIVLVSEVDGVFTADPTREPLAEPIPEITPAIWPSVRAALAGSHATDVTGGMLTKVETMVRLVQEVPGLTVHILSGLRPGALQARLARPELASGGTLIRADP